MTCCSVCGSTWFVPERQIQIDPEAGPGEVPGAGPPYTRARIALRCAACSQYVTPHPLVRERPAP